MAANRIHAFSDDLLSDHDAVALAELVRRREVSPVELTKAAIARIEKVDGELNAITVADYERALEEAARNRDGIFRGVPTVVKDNAHVKGLPTSFGARAVPGIPAKSDDRFLKQYLSLGVIMLGKTNLPEFGFNCTAENLDSPPTRNPWHTDYSTGGSSAGAAALVASGAVPIAHANDGGGSIRIPASICGLVGLKVSRGRLVQSDIGRTLPVKIVVEGVLTRSVRDTAYFLAGAERYWRNRKLPSMDLVEGPSKRRLKIGVVVDSITGLPTCPETRRVVEETAALLSNLGHHVDEMHPPISASFADDFADYWSFLGFMVMSMGHRNFGKGFNPALVDGLTRGLASRFRRRAWRLPLFLYRLQRTHSQHARIRTDFHLVLSPVVSHVTPKIGYFSPNVPYPELFQRMTNYASFTPVANANGNPAISLPAGLSTGGLPIGVQFSAAYGDERTLLEIAYELEAAKPWPKITAN